MCISIDPATWSNPTPASNVNLIDWNKSFLLTVKDLGFRGQAIARAFGVAGCQQSAMGMHDSLGESGRSRRQEQESLVVSVGCMSLKVQGHRGRSGLLQLREQVYLEVRDR